MQTLTITKEMAAAAYKNADQKEKQLLENLLGKENVQPQKITDRVKTFEDACNLLSIKQTPDLLPPPDEIAYRKLKIIAEALNERWLPDWTNSSEYKWYPYFDMTSGSGLSFHAAGGWFTDTGVGSRLCFKSRELAEYAGKHFIELYSDLFIIK